jgi:hypothetical protein
MADFETAINDAIKEQDIPGAVLVSTNRDGILPILSSPNFCR